MTRDEIIKCGALALVERTPEQGWHPDELQAVTHFGPGSLRDMMRDLATTVIEAVLPQVTTVAGRDALPVETVVRSTAGTIASRFDTERGVLFGMSLTFPWRTLQLPLVVLWQPGAGDRS